MTPFLQSLLCQVREHKLSEKFNQIGYWEYDSLKQKFYFEPFLRDLLNIPDKASNYLDINSTLLLHKEYQKIFLQALENCFTTGESFHLEVPLNTVSSIAKWFRISGAIKLEENFTKKIIGFIEEIPKSSHLNHHNYQSIDFYSSLLDHSDAAIILLDENGKFLFQSKSVEKIVGHSVEEKSVTNIFEFVDPNQEEALRAAFQQILSKPYEKLSSSFRFRHIEGHYVWLEGTGINLLHDPVIQAILVTYKDCSIQKQSEQLLLQHQERVASLSRSTKTVVWELDRDGKFTFINDTVEELTSLIASEIVGVKYFHELYPESSKHFLQEKGYELLRRDKILKNFELPLNTPKGVFWVSNTVLPKLDNAGKLIGYLGSSTDITDRKKMELELQNRNTRFEQLAIASRSVVWETNSQGLYTYVGESIEHLLGYMSSELEAKKYFYDLFPTNERTHFKEKGLHYLNNRSTITDFINPLEHKNGSIVWVKSNAFPLFSENGDFIGYRGIDVDVTQRLEIENALKQREYDLSIVNASLSDYINLQAVLVTIASNYINIPLSKVNEAIQQSLKMLGEYTQADRVYIFEYNYDKQICTNTFEWCAPEIIPQFDALQAVPLADMVDWIKIHNTGEAVYVANVYEMDENDPIRLIIEPQEIKSLVTFPLMENGSCIGFVGFDFVSKFYSVQQKELLLLSLFSEILMNIRSRQKVEEELSRTKSMLTEAGQMNRMGAWEYDPVTKEVIWSDVTKAIHEVDKDYIPTVDEGILFYKEGESRNKISQLFQKLVNEFVSYDDEFEIVTAKGNHRWVRSMGRVDLKNNIIHRVYGTFQDITERKLSEDRLKMTELKLNAYYKNTSEAILFLDVDFSVIDFNDVFEKKLMQLFGLTIQKNTSVFQFAALKKDTFWERLFKACLDGHTQNSEYRLIYKGVTYWWDLYATPIEGVTGVVTGLAVGFKEISEKKELEKRLELERKQKQVDITKAILLSQEKEREYLGMELHDNVNQLLVSSRMYLSLYRSGKMTPNEVVEKTDQLVKSAIDEIRNLSHQLIPPKFLNSNLKESLEKLFLPFQTSEDVEVHSEFQLTDESLIGESLRIAIYRITQEQISNIIKYSKANLVDFKLIQQPNEIGLSISDNGVGAELRKLQRGVGMMNMQSRVEAQQGRMTVICAPNQGFELKFVFPLIKK